MICVGFLHPYLLLVFFFYQRETSSDKLQHNQIKDINKTSKVQIPKEFFLVSICVDEMNPILLPKKKKKKSLTTKPSVQELIPIRKSHPINGLGKFIEIYLRSLVNKIIFELLSSR